METNTGKLKQWTPFCIASHKLSCIVSSALPTVLFAALSITEYLGNEKLTENAK